MKIKKVIVVFSSVMILSFCFTKLPLVQAYQYNIASISKIVTTMAVMKLVDERKIDLNGKVTTYIPEFTMKDPGYQEITVRMLLNHSSGLMGTIQYHVSTLGTPSEAFHDKLLEKLAPQMLKAEPGSYSVYCNNGFSLAELLVEKVSGVSFTEYIEKNLFGPLGMTDSLTPQSGRRPVDLARTYINDMKLEDEICNALGDGGIISTTDDLVKLSTVYMKHGSGLLSEQSRTALHTSEIANNTYKIEQGEGSYNFGLGWDTVSAYPFDQLGIQALSKGGDLISCHGNLTVLPEENMSCAVLTTGGTSELASIMTNELLLLALEEKGICNAEDAEALAVEKKEGERIPENMKEYAGLYIGSKMYQVSFPDEITMNVSTCDQEIDRDQTYFYQGEGVFQSEDSSFLTANGMELPEGGKKGNTQISFETMEDGNILLHISTIVNYKGIGSTAVSVPIAQKADTDHVDEEILQQWKQRDGMNYFIINDAYTSEYLINFPSLQIKLSKVNPGYVQSSAYLHVTKVIDDHHSRDILRIPGMVGRDWNDLEFVQENGQELLHVSTSGGIYLPESDMEELMQTDLIYETQADHAHWYKIGEKTGGKEVTFTTTAQAAVYVYNKYRSCIYTTLMKNQNGHILLPKEGYLLFIGEDNNKITME